MDLMTLANFSHIRQSEISLADLTISTNFRQFLFLHAFWNLVTQLTVFFSSCTTRDVMFFKKVQNFDLKCDRNKSPTVTEVALKIHP